MSAYVGRDVLVEYAIGLETASVGALTFKTLGMMRSKELNATWDKVDTTADKSPAFTKTSLVTFKQVEFSGDGVSYSDDVYNQNELEAHVVAPGATTQNQPKVWLRITYPDKVYVGPFIVDSWSNSSAYDAEATWSISASSNGDVALSLI